jgi:molybdopterin-guanine dinucleotide biosynthesis protein A
MRKDTTGVILAGGKSSRMWIDKALLVWKRKPLIGHVAGTLREVFPEVVVISDRAKAHGFLGLSVFPDIHKDCGPLGGVYAAFAYSQAPTIFVVLCDAPFISRELIEYVVGFKCNGDVKIPSSEGVLHPLCGVYSRRCFPDIEESLRSRMLKILELYTEFPTTVIPIAPQLPFYRSDLFLNFNDMQGYKDFVKYDPLER